MGTNLVAQANDRCPTLQQMLTPTLRTAEEERVARLYGLGRQGLAEAPVQLAFGAIVAFNAARLP